MCQTRTIRYICGHRVEFRLSTCLGNKVYPRVIPDCGTRSGTHPSGDRIKWSNDVICHGTSTLCLTSQANCGNCQGLASLVGQEKILPKPRRRTARVMWEQDCVDGDEGDGRGETSESVNDARQHMHEPSLLRQELRPEDVVLTYEENPFEFAEAWDPKTADDQWNRFWNALPAEEEDSEFDTEEEGLSNENSHMLACDTGYERWTEEDGGEWRGIESDAFGQSNLFPGWICASDGNKICCF